MKPELREGEFVFCSITDADKAVRALPDAIAFFREAEGISMILPLVAARGLGVATDQPMRCMTLMVYSALDGVGLTAAVATALAEENIPCNMVAAHHHDHAFVPSHDAERALTCLRKLQAAAQ